MIHEHCDETRKNRIGSEAAEPRQAHRERWKFDARVGLTGMLRDDQLDTSLWH